MIYNYIDGCCGDWAALENYVDTHDLQYPDEELCFIDGLFNFNLLVYEVFRAAIEKVLFKHDQEENYKLLDALVERIYTNYLNSFINIDLDDLNINKELKEDLESIKHL